ncbi:organic cation transporter protein [Contarinia nasturtii]|uniref:organic cation transporter protein n=1 Tax=Contarinia nasturtii TaxID=265458 RepID=UPI0012D41C57|nr:organic cation transporter protein [Contarinia nasturtii]XP_031621226.1 organic cation transporter protein [Contarinia nasturtii]XP_031621227.1 organic cation transporter protein [Contarinia nasturtii]
MSNNRTSISDRTPSHRQLHGEPDKQHNHEQMNAMTKSNKHSSQNHHLSSHEDCDIIGEIIGKYGKYQFFMTFLLSLFQIPNTFHISSPIYQAADKHFWCKRPDNLSHIDINVWRNLSGLKSCSISKHNWNQITNTHMLEALVQNTTDPIKCTEWEFDMADNLGNTWTSQWSLVCDSEYLKNVAEMFFLVGVASGGIISGYLSDKFGRRTMLFWSVIFQTIFGIVLYIPLSFRVHLALRGLLGLVSVSVTYAGLILAIEFVDGKWRTIAGMYNLFPLPVSYMLISGIAYLTQDFRVLQLCIAIPGIFLCFLWFVIPESPRWLLCKGRTAEVATIIRKICAVNKRECPPNVEKLLKPPPSADKTNDGCISLFGNSYLRLITICFPLIWFTINLVYYGLILNMNSFDGNVYLNSALAGLVELPAIGIAIIIIMWVGKKWILFSTMFCAGVSCLCITFIGNNSSIQWLKITFLMLGKFTISAGNTVMPVYTAELYPTAIRNAGVGACNMAAGVALIIVPYLSLLDQYYLMLLVALFSMFGSLVVICLPESMPHNAIKRTSNASQHSGEEQHEERAYVFSA